MFSFQAVCFTRFRLFCLFLNLFLCVMLISWVEEREKYMLRHADALDVGFPFMPCGAKECGVQADMCRLYSVDMMGLDRGSVSACRSRGRK